MMLVIVWLLMLAFLVTTSSTTSTTPADVEVQGKDAAMLLLKDTFLDLSTQDLIRRIIPTNLPNGPDFVGFQDLDLLKAAVTAYIEVLLLARAGMNGVCQRTSSFTRYFNEDDADTVFKVYQTIFGPRGEGPVNMTFPWWPLQVLYSDQAVAGDTINQCAAKPNLEGMCYNDRPDGKGSAIMLCPRLFQRYYRPLRQFECGQIGSYMSENYLTAGSILLHEFTHWNTIILPAILKRVVDYGMDEESGNVINPNDDPPHGYGPRNCMRLRELSKSPTTNADSYMWFALESYWIQECEGKEMFDDPPLGQGSSRVGDDTAV